MTTGTVKYWNEERGYGFIKPDDSPADIFVHAKDIAGSAKSLDKDQMVSFEPFMDEKRGKPRAVNVRVI